jgi:hypothetical protein
MHNEPGTAVALHPGTGSPLAAFMFRTPARIDHRDSDASRELLRRVYRNVGWRTRELLSAYLATGDRYFDSISKIRMSSWSRGRVTLLGDAASCVSLFGDGSSSAMEGGGNARRVADLVTRRHPSCLCPLRVGSSISDAPSAAGCLDRFPSPDSKITTGHHSPQSRPPARQPRHFRDCC